MSTTAILNNGTQMPLLGFGVFQTPPDLTAAAVAAALRTGCRLIDTAAAYGRSIPVSVAARSRSRSPWKPSDG